MSAKPIPSPEEATEQFFARSREEWDKHGGHPAFRNASKANAGTARVEPHERPLIRHVELSQFIDMDLEPPAPMVGDIFRPGTLALGHGPTGVGKTYFKLAIATYLAHGVDVLGWRIPEPQPVLYVDGELPAWLLQQRAKQLSDPIRETIGHPWKPLYFVTPDLEPNGIPKIDTTEGQYSILQLVDFLEDVRLVVFDNLSCLTNPKDDNTSASWSAVQDLLLALRRRRVAALVGHHSGKGGQQRGTSRRTDILDVVVKLTPQEGQADGRTRVNVEFEKGRMLTSEQKAPFTACLEPHPAGGLVWTRAACELPVQDRVRQMLLDGMPPGDVATELKTARSYVYRIRTEMTKAGDLKVKGTTGSRDSVVPLSPSLKRGQGTERPAAARDKRGDSKGTEGTA